MWERRPDGVYVSDPLAEDPDDPRNLIFFCEPLEVSEKKVNLLTGVEYLNIVIEKKYSKKSFTVERIDINENRIIDTMTAQGLSVLSSDNAQKTLKCVIIDSEARAPVNFFHEKLGMIHDSKTGRKLFLWNNPIGGDFSEVQKSSMYFDPRITEPRGSFGSWRSFIIDNVVVNPALCLTLSMGATAPVVAALKDEGTEFELPIYALVGDSSVGKSTILYLQASIYASPRYFIGSFNATSNALSAMLAVKSVPVLADEATHTSHIDWNDLAYGIPSGKEKRRCDGDGKLKPLVEYDSTLIVTSEKSILDKTSGHGGEYARIIEFDLKWFNSAKEADATKEFCSKNYGFAVTKMMELILQDGFAKKLAKQYKKDIAALRSSVEIRSGIEDRIIKKLALILTSGWFLQKAVKVDLHLDEVKLLLLKVFAESVDFHAPVDDADAMLDYFAGEILKNQDRYPTESQLSSKSKRCFTSKISGVKGFWGDNRCVWILKDEFRDMLKKKPQYGYRTACKKLEKAGYLPRFFNDRFYKQKDFGSMTAECYCLIFPEATTITDTVNNASPYNRKLKNISYILNEDDKKLDDYSDIGINTKKMMTVSFLRLTPQLTRMVLCPELLKQMNCSATDRVFLTPIRQEGVLLLSKNKIVEGSHKIRLHNWHGNGYSETSYIHALPEAFDVRLEDCKRLILNDVKIEKKDDISSILIMNFENDFGKAIIPLNEDDPLSIDNINEDKERSDNLMTRSARRNYLINDDE